MIFLKAVLTSKPGLISDLAKVANICAAETRLEPGCISYEFLLSTEDNVTGIFIEEWESQEALDLHMKTPHFLTFAQNSRDLLTAKPVVRVFNFSEIKK